MASGSHQTSLKIESITPVASDPTLRKIQVGRKIVATLRETDVDRLKLEVGQNWTPLRARSVEAAASTQKARKAALTMLGRRAFSSADLLQRLIAKGHEETAATQVVKELVADRWIDDAAFARDAAAHELKKGVGSKEFLKAKLEYRKFDEEVRDQTAKAAMQQFDAQDAAISLVKRKLGNLAHLPRNKAQGRVASLLSRRGFDEDAIRAVFDQLNISDVE